MTPLSLWAVIAGGMLVTYATRLSFTVFWPADRLGPRVREALRYAPASVLAAIILPALLLPEGADSIRLAQPHLFAGVVAAVVAWRTRSSWLTIATGMAVLWILQAIGLGT